MRHRSDPFILESLALLAVIFAFLLALAAVTPSPSSAVCSTDADCAQWEVDHHVPTSERCYGGPCSARGAR